MIAETTQYLRPVGIPVIRKVVIPDDCQHQYELIHFYGCKLTCERLMTNQVVQYISNDNGDFASIITVAGEPKVAIAALIKLIEGFDKGEFEKWSKKQARN